MTCYINFGKNQSPKQVLRTDQNFIEAHQLNSLREHEFPSKHNLNLKNDEENETTTKKDLEKDLELSKVEIALESKINPPTENYITKIAKAANKTGILNLLFPKTFL